MSSKLPDMGLATGLVDSPKQRRLLSRSDEEIMEEIDNRMGERIGWPKPLPVLPLVRNRIEDEPSVVPDIDEVRRHVTNVLETQRVLWDGRFYFAYHLKYGRTPTAEDISLIIPSPQTASSWVHALKEIRKYFVSKGIHYRIEFINIKAMDPFIFTVLPDNPVVDLWYKVYRPKVLAAVHGKAWQSINVFHVGFADSREECPVTVVIHAWDAEDDDWWSSIIPRLTSAGPGKIRLLGAQPITAMDRDLYTSARSLLLEDFQGPLSIGASLGVKGAPGGGTLGGVLEMEWPDKSKSSLGITNHHVVLDDQLLQETQNNAAFTPGNQLARKANLILSSPCDADTAERIRAIEATISILNRRAHGDATRGVIGLQQKGDLGDDSKAGALQKVLENIAREEAEKEQIASSDRHLGHVVASSGYRTVEKDGFSWGMGWALSKLTGQRPMENRIVQTTSNDNMYGSEGEEIRYWSKGGMEIGVEVSKKGRTTGWTDGTVNSIKSDLNLMKEENGQELNPYGKQITAWVVHSPTVAGKFCSPGDSGSLVLNLEGSIVGLLFGSDIHDGHGYVVPFDMIVEDIESVTGGKVVSPSKEE